MLATTDDQGKKCKIPLLEKAKAVDVGSTVAELSVTYPALYASAFDIAFHAMKTAELVSLWMEDGGGVVLPQGLRVHTILHVL